MEQKLLVLCDPEEDYAQHMADFLRKRKEASWEILVYTKPQELMKLAQKKKIEILLISESAYGGFVEELQVKLLALLNESGMLQEKQLVNIDKYQAAEKVRQELLAHYMELENDFFPLVGCKADTRLIGLFSPVRRCLQTTFGLTYGQLLAEKHRTLYLSFEPYAGWEEWKECRQQDISSLLYYQQEEGFSLHMQTIVRRMGNLEYVTSMANGENLLYITAGEWQKLLRAIVESGVYEYVILDLSESMQGLFEILRMCSRVYTIVKEDAKAKSKLEQYEQLLSLQKYEDVRGKTSKCRLPTFHKLPVEVEQYTKGELAEYIKGMLRQEEG